jgi:hypothetical protein
MFIDREQDPPAPFGGAEFKEILTTAETLRSSERS